MEESTFLSRSFADQGLKIRIRKELRQRRKLSKISDMEENDVESPASGSDVVNTNVPPPTITTKKNYTTGGKRVRGNHNNDTSRHQTASWTSPLVEQTTAFHSADEVIRATGEFLAYRLRKVFFFYPNYTFM